jgi:hypothetical protein
MEAGDGTRMKGCTELLVFAPDLSSFSNIKMQRNDEMFFNRCSQRRPSKTSRALSGETFVQTLIDHECRN